MRLTLSKYAFDFRSIISFFQVKNEISNFFDFLRQKIFWGTYKNFEKNLNFVGKTDFYKTLQEQIIRVYQIKAKPWVYNENF